MVFHARILCSASQDSVCGGELGEHRACRWKTLMSLGGIANLGGSKEEQEKKVLSLPTCGVINNCPPAPITALNLRHQNENLLALEPRGTTLLVRRPLKRASIARMG